jgi:branched-chain amino acid aminotransferase
MKPFSESTTLSITHVDGGWQEGNVPLFHSMTHAAWLGSVVFDGARAFEGVAPDLHRHCARTVASAHSLGLAPMLTAGEIEELSWDGIRRFAPGTALYIRPMFWAEDGFVAPAPESTRFALVIWDAPLPAPTGFSACVSSYRRPLPNTAPTDAKAACLYPNAGRALVEAEARGYENAVVLDPIGNVAELATANLVMVKDGVAITPAPNGTFLNGITRQRVWKLLRAAGIEVIERRLEVADLMQADEVFSTGNYSKVVPISRIETRDFQPGPVYKRARELYWDFAHSR